MNHFLLSLLVCPLDKHPLVEQHPYLVCSNNHKYPVVNDIPVMLTNENCPTLWVSNKSLESANNFVLKQDLSDHFFIETLGLSAEERNFLEENIKNKTLTRKLEIIVSYLLGATSGNMYKGMECDLNQLPLPKLPLVKGSGLFLDIGCNWGRWSIAASKVGFNVIGLDPSLGALMAAKEICQHLKINANFVCADSRCLPFSSEKFDVVFSYSVFQHFDKIDVITSLKEIHKVLKQGGISLIQMANMFGILFFYNQMKRGFCAATNFDVRYWNPSELRRTFGLNIGPSWLYVDCFLGLGIQQNQIKLLPPYKKIVLFCSSALKTLATFIPFLSLFADSLFVKSVKQS